MAISSATPDERRRIRLPSVAVIATCTLLGIVIGDLLQLTVEGCLDVLLTWLIAALILRRFGRKRSSFQCRCIAMFCVGMLRMSVQQTAVEGIPLQSFCDQGPVKVFVTGTVTSLPVVHRKAESVYAPRMYGPPHQTRFRVDVRSVTIAHQTHSVRARCQVHLEGQANDRLAYGDIVRIFGRLDWPQSPGNPGEFDYEGFLLRKQLAGMLYVNNISAVDVVEPASKLTPLRLLGELRNEIYRILVLNVDADVRGIALALLLGSRHELPADVERAFVASGTMHLLAISGLHVGILCLFLMQIQHALLVRRTVALLLTLAVCVAYAFLTDLRPSVVRATLFFVVFVVGELFHRQQNIIGLLSLTALIMLMLQPAIVFEIGAWLSFLSVAGLGWQASLREPFSEAGTVPLDYVTWNDRAMQLLQSIGRRLKFRWRQMIAILIFTTPLVVSTFHVFSPIGLLVNLALIPLTAVALCMGFVTVSLGLLFRNAAALSGAIFSQLLQCIEAIVSTAATVRFGHVFIANLPGWFVPGYYVLLLTTLFIARTDRQRLALATALAIGTIAAVLPIESPKTSVMRCTILDVGQGNATIVECPNGDVFIVDVGARNRSDRTADIVSRYLWERGISKVAGIFVSHADTDHFNGLPGIMARMDVRRIYLPTNFHASDRPSVTAIMAMISEHHIPVTKLTSGQQIVAGDVRLNIHQAATSADEVSLTADEFSLVVIIAHHHHRIVLPADLRDRGADLLLPKIGRADVLVTPNHGSIGTNTAATAAAIHPTFAIASSSAAKNRTRLENIYASSKQVIFTAESGAVSITSEPRQQIRVATYR